MPFGNDILINSEDVNTLVTVEVPCSKFVDFVFSTVNVTVCNDSDHDKAEEFIKQKTVQIQEGEIISCNILQSDSNEVPEIYYKDTTIRTGKPKLKYGKCDFVSFTNEWEVIDWKLEFNELDINQMWKVFSDKYLESINKYVPKTYPKPGCMKKPLWMTFDCLCKIKRKKRAWARNLATRRVVDYETYKTLRNQTNDSVHVSKKNFEKFISEKSKTEPKHFRSYIKSKTKSKTTVSNLTKEDRSFTLSNSEKGSVLNKVFASVFTNENDSNIPVFEDKDFDTLLEHFVLSEATVEKHLLTSNISKSIGPDNIHPLIVKNDTKIYAPTAKSDVIQGDLDALYTWSDLWDMKFNVDKCKMMHNGRESSNHVYNMNDTELREVNEEKNLGVLFQNNLKFSQHISSKANKANSILGLINRTFSYLDRFSFMRIYTALVRPHLEYGNTIWYPHLRKDIESVEKVQMRATKLLPARHLNYENRLITLKLPTLAHRRRRGDMIQTFKILKGFGDIPYERFFTVLTSNTRGHSFKFIKPRFLDISLKPSNYSSLVHLRPNLKRQAGRMSWSYFDTKRSIFKLT
ncbi:unnamed protein product [Mytilus coruscus]|uniref:Reverse transcriptase domain-containing protein n=1 Tax=Mytilus coruscus TaxID=42192 RepID=A0A6J8BH77_MYTCO|nr:unnamed protein product [Mytilus coruscus]